MRIKDIMSKNIHSCSTDDSLETVAGKMWDHDLGCLPVVDGDGRVVGLITDRDICMAAYTQGLPLHHIPVTTAMSKEVFSCSPDDAVAKAEETMRARQVRRLPVLDQTKIVGMVSLCDLAREAELETGLKRQDVTGHEVTDTLAKIAQPRVEQA